MGTVLKTIYSGILISITFFFQFAVSLHAPGFFFFPAVAWYAATFLPVSHALFLGVLMGSMLDGLSPFPFGVYVVGIGGGMTGAAAGMRFVDERHIGAHGIVALALTGIITLVASVFYFLGGYEPKQVVLHLWDMVSVSVSIIGIAGLHALMRRLMRKRY